MTQHKEMKTMMHGAFVLTVASFIAKLLSAVYRVPFQNLVGDEGFYVYQQVYPIYGIAMTLALTGLPQFISKIVAEQTTEEQQKRTVQQLFPIVCVVAASCWAGCFFGSQKIAHAMGDSALKPLIQIVSFTFVLVPPLSFYRGVFQGRLRMIPSAISQVVEQFVRVGVILIAAYSFTAFSWSIYQTGMVAIGGALAGGIAAVAMLNYYARKNDQYQMKYFSYWKPTIEFSRLARRLLLEGGIVSFYSAFLILFQLMDSFFVKKALVLSGMQETVAKVEKGVYDRGQPLVQLGLVIALALSATFLPALTRYIVSNEEGRFLQAAKIFLRLTTTIAAAASVGLGMLLPYINFTLFKDYHGNDALTIYVASIGFMAIIQAYQSVFQSQNRFIATVSALLAGLTVKLLLTSQLTQFLGTIGASVSTILGLLITLLVLIIYANKSINFFAVENRFWLKLLVSLSLMALSLYAYETIIFITLGHISHRGQSFIISVAGVIVGAGTFIFTSIKLNLFTVREWLMIPFGKKILRMKR